MSDMIFIRFASHRARDRAMQAWQRTGLAKPQAYYSFGRDTGKGVYRVTDAHLKVLSEYGGGRGYSYGSKWYTKLRGPFDDLLRCWE